MNDWPEIFYAVLLAFGLVSMLFYDGKKGSATGAVCSVVVFATQVWVLYRGGFWSVWGISP